MYTNHFRPSSALLSAMIVLLCGPLGASVFVQTNLVSDIPGLAAVTDPNLVNPWGMSFSPTSPFWVSDQGKNVSTLYNASGAPQGGPLIVSTPGGPTGQVFNPTTGFLVGGTAATFIFSTLSGDIEAWNGAQGTTAAIVAPSTGGSYTGLTMGTVNGNSMLYAANKAGGNIVVFDTMFQPVNLGSTAFVDPGVPAGLTPYNIQNLGGKLYVEYSGARGAPGGYVAVFDTSGNLLQSINDSHLNAPWGVALAPMGFGDFGGDLLVGNFGSGMIDAFNPTTGAFAGVLTDSSGNPIVNSGLWALEFRTPVAGNANTGSDPNSLFFVAGINGETDGLFGRINPTPEPGTLATAFLVLAGVFCLRVLRNRPAISLSNGSPKK
jgi:uncharacterized protein (TIGR03118 family)